MNIVPEQRILTAGHGSPREDQKIHIDIASNRQARKYSPSEQLRRALWIVGGLLIRLSPRPMFAWRRWVLRLFGAKIGRNVHLYPTTRICMPWNLDIGDWAALGEDTYVYNLGPVIIGSKATLSYRTHICAGSHDFSDPTLPLLKPAVTIGAGAWIGTQAFIGPGVAVGDGAIVGAASVVMRPVGPFEVVAGNPARVIGIRTPAGIKHAGELSGPPHACDADSLQCLSSGHHHY